MAILDAMLAGLLDRLHEQLRAAGFSRERGGLARGILWAEMSGRLDNGSWVELRLHHDDRQHRVSAGLLEYRPLSRGGQTVVVGKHAAAYHLDPTEIADELATTILSWLPQLAETRA